MSSRLHNSNLTKFIIIVEFLLVAYLLYSLTKNVYNSYQVDKYIKTFEDDNALIAEENKRKSEDYLYFTSDEYIDKIAKQNLGLINPGEEVIIIASDTLEDDDGFVDEDPNVAVYAGESSASAWWQLFFGD